MRTDESVIQNPGSIDQSLVADGFLFATHRDRGLYIGTSTIDRPRWLEDHPGSWRRIVDVQREAAAPAPPAENETNVGAAQSALKLPPPDKAAMRESVRSHTQPNLLEAAGRKRDRSSGRQLKKQKLPAENCKVGRKRTAACMVLFLDALAKCRIVSKAARKAGIHRHTVTHWRKGSAAGHARYDIEWRGETAKFHEHCESAIEDAHDKLIALAYELAMGGVVYKYDELLLSLGYEGPDAYLRDENGDPVIEIVRNPNPKMIRFYLEWKHPDKWGKRRKIDVPQKGGVLVIDDNPKKLRTRKATAASIEARQWKSRSRMIRKAMQARKNEEHD